MSLKLSALPVFPRPRILVLDCGARHVACGLFTAGTGGRLVLRQLAFEPHQLDPRANANWSEMTGRALAAIARREKFGGACRLALPGHHTLVKFVRTPLIKGARQAGVIEFEARQNIPCPLEQVAWDHLLVAEDGADLEIMLAAIKNDVAGAMHGATGTAGFRVSQMVPSSIALLHAFRYCHPTERHGVLLVEIGARSTHLVFIDGDRFFIRTFSLGGDVVTQAVADELQIDFAAAETRKIQVLAGSCTAIDPTVLAAVRRATVNFAGRLHLEIVRSTIGCLRYSGPARPTTVHLTGGGAIIPELPALLADKLALRVVCFDPLRNIAVLPPARVGAAAAAPMLAGLVGLATSLTSGRWPGLNLLPPAVIKAGVSRRRQPVLLAAATMAVVAPLPVIWHYHRVTTAAGRVSGGVERRLAPLRALAARNTTNLARIRETKQRIDDLRGLVESKSNWIIFLNDLQGRLAQAEDVWLERLQIAQPLTAPGAPPAAARRFILSGRLLDRNNPVSKVSTDSYGRIRGLLQLLSQSPFIATVENEHFDNPQPGILRFDFTLVLDSRRTL